MFKVLKCIADTYVTDRIINGVSQVTSNVGEAASLDLFKLYGYTATIISGTSFPNTEISRLLLHFDLQPLRDLVTNGMVDYSNTSFSCELHLYDVNGGQPVPDNFTIVAFPLGSGSFTEGHGRDVVFYSDTDVCNWLTSSYASGSWYISGCGLGGDAVNAGACDYVATFSGSNLAATQFFSKGTEDLCIDVTRAVSATLAGGLPDSGFRLSFTSSFETDAHTYFVKRFAGRNAFNKELQPKLIVRFNDSVQDDTDNVYLDSPSTLFLYNYVRSSLTNLSSGSSQVSGSNCVMLQMTTPVSGGIYSIFFTGSQYTHGVYPVVGMYSASVTLSSNNPLLLPQWQASGSIVFTPIWGSLDKTVTYLTGSTIKVYPPQRGSKAFTTKNFYVSILNLKDEHEDDETVTVGVNIFDYSQPYLLSAIKLPVELPGIVVRNVYYQVRDNDDGFVAIPFDTTTNSTLVSNDSSGMFFNLDMSNLTSGHSYVVDVLVVTNNIKTLFKDASAPFRVVEGK